MLGRLKTRVKTYNSTTISATTWIAEAHAGGMGIFVVSKYTTNPMTQSTVMSSNRSMLVAHATAVPYNC